MNIRPKWLRDLLSVVFSIGYIFHSDAALEKVRKYKACCTIDTLRVSWEKQVSNLITKRDFKGILKTKWNIVDESVCTFFVDH